MIEIIKAYFLGICAAAAIGPVMILILQKTLNNGRTCGRTAGMGSTLVDTFYAIIAIFAVSAVQDYINGHNTLIRIIGGSLILIIGIIIAFRKFTPRKQRIAKASASDFVEAMLMALSNPGALALMLAMFIIFRINTDAAPKILILAAISAGSASWWMFFSFMVDKYGKNLSIDSLRHINRIVSIFVIIFGICMLTSGILRIWNITLIG